MHYCPAYKTVTSYSRDDLAESNIAIGTYNAALNQITM